MTDEMNITKVCSRCKIEKPAGAFAKRNDRKIGLTAWCKQCRKEYREANKERFLEYGRQYYHSHKEQNYAHSLRYRQIYKERYREHERKYYRSEAGKEARLRKVHNRRARKAQAENTLTLTLQELVKLQNGKCYYCHQKFTKNIKPSLDHIVPIKLGGGNTNDNVVAACKSCNSSKGAKTPEDFAQKIGRLFL